MKVAVGLSLDPDRIEVLEGLPDLLEREVGVRAAVTNVLHVWASRGVKGVEEGVCGAVELEGAHSESFAQTEVECGGGLQPPIAMRTPRCLP